MPTPQGKGKSPSFPVVGVGASAGGLEALRELIQNLSPDTGVALVIIQHLQADGDSMLSEILGRLSPIPVLAAADGLRIEPRHIYVMPAHADLEIFHGKLVLVARASAHQRHLPIDRFFISLAADQHERAIGVVLSGAGADGTVGLTAIKSEGGITFAQDPLQAGQDDMPRHAIQAGSVDIVLPAAEIARELTGIGGHPYLVEPAAKVIEEVTTGGQEGLLQQVFLILRHNTGMDFSGYKRATFARRLAHRMLVRKIEDLEGYVRFLQENPDEVEALFQDVLIMVTEFFRDPETFDYMAKEVFPRLVEGKEAGETLRLWVVGCSSGQEVYSLAISLLEFLGSSPSFGIQIFGTDINERDIETARAGLYPASITSVVSPERLRRFFTLSSGGYRINQSVRAMCTFAKHDLTRDPPFSRMDLVSCRNVLIYFDTVLQERVVPIFHYSLVPDGVLLLGRSETVRVGSNLFHLLDKKHHVYSRSPGPGKLPILLAQPDGGGHRWMPKTAAGLQKPLDSYSVQREADEALAQAYAPASVVVDDGHQVLSFRGSTTTYLQHPTGRATLDIFQMAREGLAYELRSALQEAKETEAAARRSGVSVLADGARRSLDLEVTPFRSTDGRIYFVISFREPQMAKARPQRKGKLSEPAPAASQTEADLLRLELEAAREHLQSVSTEKDVSAEELRASFEELQSSNEELQSTNEELETAKEELQSINEELSTVNDELTTRNLELARAHNDLANFVNSVNVPIVMLDRQLRVRRYTPGTDAVLHIVPTDVGRLITQIKPKVDVPDLESVLLEAIESLSPAVRDVKDGKGHWYSMRVRPYQTAEGQVEGAVLTFVDVDELKQSLDHLAESKRLGDAVNEIGISINSTFDFDEIMSRMMERAGKALASQSAAILIAVDSGWTIRHSLGLPEKLLNASFTDAQLPQAALARTTRLPVATPDAGNDERVTPAFRARFEAGPELVVPLMMKDVTLGVLVIGRRAKGPSFNEAECDFGLKLGVAVSLALENASLLRELQAAEIASATLSQILADIAASRDVNQRLGDVLERAAAVLGADRAISAFRGRHGWEIGHVTGLPPELIGSAWGAKEADAFPTRVDPTQPLVVIEASDIRVDSVFLKKHGISSLFLVPLSQAGVVARLFLFGFSSKREIPSKTEEDFLAKLSASVSLGLDNSRSFASEHRLAESLRRRLSPPTPNLSGLDIGAALRMAVEVDNVGGDFYEVFPFDNDHAVLLIGDVMGKGLPAAELTDTIRASARTAALINPSPVFILEMVDRVLRGLDGGARSASGLVAIIDLKTGDLEIAGAGHPPGVLCAATCRLLPHPFGPPLGFAAGPYQSAVSVLNLDETLVLYTDGLIEARRGDEFFGEDRLMEAAARMAGLQVQAMADALINEASEFANGELKDDVAVLVVRRVAPIS